MDDQVIAYRGIIRGRVQDVFFRAETRQQARRLQLSGWVRNTAQGHVEVLLCGSGADIREMIEWLHQGPALAKVDAVDLQEIPYPNLTSFQIITESDVL